MVQLIASVVMQINLIKNLLAFLSNRFIQDFSYGTSYNKMHIQTPGYSILYFLRKKVLTFLQVLPHKGIALGTTSSIRYDHQSDIFLYFSG